MRPEQRLMPTIFGSTLQSLASQADAGITGSSDGGFIVTWTSASASGDTSSYGVAGQRFDASGTKIGTEFLVNTTTANRKNTLT